MSGRLGRGGLCSALVMKCTLCLFSPMGTGGWIWAYTKVAALVEFSAGKSAGQVCLPLLVSGLRFRSSGIWLNINTLFFHEKPFFGHLPETS